MLAAFAVGTTETIVTGLLLNISTDLSVSIAASGMLVSGYAIAVAIAAPLLTILTLQLPQKGLLLWTMIIFIASHIGAAYADTYYGLMVMRIIAASMHGLFMGVGVVVAVRLVDANNAGKAIAIMFTGITVANVLGVPFGVLLGQLYGWRSSFWAIALLAIITLVLLAITLPKLKIKTVTLNQELTVLKRPAVWWALLTTVFSFGSTFVVFTYIVVILNDITGLTGAHITLVLLVFGVGLTVGNLIGARTTDRWPIPTILISLTLLSVLMGVFTWTAATSTAAVITIFLWGMAGYAFVPGMQLRVMQHAKEAPTLASALNISAFNIGIGGGALIGGIVVASPLGVSSTPWVGAVVTLISIAILLLSIRAERNKWGLSSRSIG
ncbi:MFS transporter [Xenorhabdus bovienii]|nr:MFS transporter [Xenorhabdus bovienii]